MNLIFETAVFLEHVKWASFTGNIPFFSYFRSKDGLEVDLLIEKAGKLYAREIKAMRTLHPSLAGNLLKLENLLQRPLQKTILAPVERDVRLSGGVFIKPWQSVKW